MSTRTFLRSFAPILAACFAAAGAPAQIVNGGFENPTPFFGWTLEYTSYGGGCTFGPWSPILPGGHPAPFLLGTNAFPFACQTLLVQPYELTKMAVINDPVGGNHATRIRQSFSPTAAEIASGCLSVQWGAMLVNGGHSGCDQPGIDVQVLKNSAVVMSYSATAANAVAEGWQIAGSCGGDLYYKHGQWVVPLPALLTTDVIEVVMTVFDCTAGGHGGYGFLDDVRFLTCTPPPPNMTGWWHDVTAKDLAGWKLNNGTWNLAALASTGYVGGSGLKHASTHFVNVPDAVNLDFTDGKSFSIDLWVKPGSVMAGLQPLVCKTQTIGQLYNHQIGYALYLDNGHPALTLGSFWAPMAYVASSVVVPANEWSHVAVTVDRVNPSIKFYFNGDLLPGTFVPITTDLSTYDPLRLGAFSDNFWTMSGGTLVAGGTTPFDGETDEIELFRRALLASEVRDVFAAGPKGKCKGMLPVATQPLPYDRNIGRLVAIGDDVLTGGDPFPFPFPFGGSTWSELRISTNGFLCLANAGYPAAGSPNGYSGSAAALSANLRNGAPRIAPYWKDLDLRPENNAGVYINHLTDPDRTVVTWLNAVEFGKQVRKTIQCQLFATGEILFFYSGGMTVDDGTGLCGVSRGGGAAEPGISDLSAQPLAGAPTVYEVFTATNRPFDLGGTNVTFTPYGSGFEVLSETAQLARHEVYGSGCYLLASSFYELFPPSGFDLSNTSLRMTPNGSGYSVTPGTGAFVPPTSPGLALTDDSQVAWTLPAPFAYTGGVTTSLGICSNGYVWLQPDSLADYTPTVGELLNGTARLAPAWCDLVPDGAINQANVFAEFDALSNTVLITWLNCALYATPGTVTVQLAIELGTGAIEYRWQSCTPALTTIAGFSPGGGVIDPGNRDLGTNLPFATASPEALPLTLGASPEPLLGTTMVLQTTNVPASALISCNVLSFAPVAPIDLGFLGAPGCMQLVDLGPAAVMLMIGSPTIAMPLAIPNDPNLAGIELFSQSVSFVPGANPFGLLTSNGLRSVVLPY